MVYHCRPSGIRRFEAVRGFERIGWLAVVAVEGCCLVQIRFKGWR